MSERNWEECSKADAYLIAPYAFCGTPSVPDRVRGAPVLAVALELHGDSVDIDKLRIEGPVQPLIIKGSKEGMKELVCKQIDMLWRASHGS